jgi:pimeloyl-ACP methyl ester carboxylesterase
LENKYFDIISFDPRGMNNTTPQVICFPDFAARIAWERSMASEGTIASSDIAFATKWARFMAIGSSCTTRMKSLREDDDNILDHMTTPNVVGDMVAIIEALGEWRENEALKMLNSTRSRGDAIYVHSPPQSPLNSLNKLEEGTEVIQRTRWKKGEEKLQYWGFSYGTVLGATFAAMQPHRVGRLILDGVEDGEDYYTAEFKSNLNDTEAVSSAHHYSKIANKRLGMAKVLSLLCYGGT